MTNGDTRPSRRNMLLGGAAGLAATVGGVQTAQAQAPARPAAPEEPGFHHG